MKQLTMVHKSIYGFLLLTLLVGLHAGRNVKTFRDYALANRSLGTGVLVMTLLATMVNAGWISRISYTYLAGPFPVWLNGAILLTSFLPASHFLAPHFQRFPHCYTLSQLLGELYGPAARRSRHRLPTVRCVTTCIWHIGLPSK